MSVEHQVNKNSNQPVPLGTVCGCRFSHIVPTAQWDLDFGKSYFFYRHAVPSGTRFI